MARPVADQLGPFQRTVLAELAENGPASAAEVARRIGETTPTGAAKTRRAVQGLAARGLVASRPAPVHRVTAEGRQALASAPPNPT